MSNDRKDRRPVKKAAPRRLKRALKVVPVSLAKTKALEFYRDCGIIRDAMESVGYTYESWDDWQKADPDFARAVAIAREESVQALERSARQRAQKMSDTLMIFLLKAARPEVYRERIDQRVSGDTDAPLRVIVQRGDEPPGDS